MKAPENSFRCRTRVRYGETDKMGIAYYGRYADWFETGRTEFCRHGGKSYTEWEAEGIMLPVVELSCRYKSSLLYDDEVEIETWVSDLSRVSVTFSYNVFHAADGRLAAEGSTKHAFTDTNGKLIKKGCALEQWLREKTVN